MMARPKIVYFIAFAILSVVLSLPIQSALLYQNNLKELPEIFAKLTYINWMMAIVLTATALAVFNVSPHIKALVPFSVALVGWNNYLAGSYNTDYSLSQALLGAGLFAGLMVPLLKKDVRYLLNNPKMRWWARSPRKNRSVPVTVNPYVGSTWQTKTFDISETGAFISFERQNFEELPKIGEHLKLNLNINTLKKIKCEAIVVRVEEPKGMYPRGIGVKFIKIKGDQKRNLSNYLEH